ncbi:MAG: hypothetical protein JXX14_14190 [Deltaproteobacteria bacterium]|nr:hypothetical protein [Deltaproteobacteria bacterium]
MKRYGQILLFLLVVIATSALSTGLAAQRICDGDAAVTTTFAVAFHVATRDEPRTLAHIEAILSEANRQFAGAGIEFRMSQQRMLAESFQVMETIRERHQVKPGLVDRVINVVVVDEIQDPTPSKATRKAAAAQGRKPSGRLAGAHIPAPRKKPDTYILLASNGKPDTLAHELGHFFGLPHHRDPQNVMSYGRDRKSFNEHQLAVIRKKARLIQRRHIVNFTNRCTDR